jgi:hypothetical protein
MNESGVNKIDFSKLYKTKKNYTDYKNEITQNHELIIFKTILWYNPLKKIRDYGFYATFDETNNDEHMKLRGFSDIIISFQLNEKLDWIQIDNDAIYGFVCLDGKKCLDYLNGLSSSMYNKKGICIRNKFNERIASNFW